MQPMGYLSSHEPPVIGPPWIAALLRALGPGPTRHLHRFARALTGYWAREWRDIRAELGLPNSCEHPLWEGQHSRLRSLGLFPRSLGAPQPDWPPQARVTGFPFYRAPHQALDHRLERFLAGGDAPLVFTLGTTAVHDPGHFYEESAAAAARLGMRAVLVGAPNGNGHVYAESSNLLVAPYAPYHLLFPRARAIVHQGGIGTLSEALLARRPMLIMPYGHDQADNAWRASRLGVARVLPRHRYRRDAVRRALQELLEASARTTAVARAGDAIAREEGAEAAARQIVAALS
jgi:UDP:flavonoid glycosyltransferase YjiC (YdhE family)